MNRLWLSFYYSIGILFLLVYINSISNVHGQTQTFPMPSISKLPAVKITFPHNGDNVTVQEPLSVTGISSDDDLTNCQVSIIMNNVKPYHDVNATGKSGSREYSTWNYTQNLNISQLKVGANKLTSKITCPGNATNSTKWYSINVTGISPASGKIDSKSYANNNTATINASQLASEGKNILPQEQVSIGNNLTVQQKQITSPSLTTGHPSLLAVSKPPVANAGADQTVRANSVVTLNGAQSKDADGKVTSYSWVQLIGGANVALRNADSSVAILKISNLKENTLLKFKITVVDNDNLSSSDTTNVLVRAKPQSVISKDVPCERIGITNSC